MKYNTGKVCLIKFSLIMVVSIEECVSLAECVFREGNRYTDLVQEQFAEKFPETLVPRSNAVRRLTEKFREIGSVLVVERSGRPSKFNHIKLTDISVSMLLCSPSKSFQQHSSNFQNADMQKAFANKIKRVKAWIDAREHHFQNLKKNTNIHT
jgi:hypothetical protein